MGEGVAVARLLFLAHTPPRFRIICWSAEFEPLVHNIERVEETQAPVVLPAPSVGVFRDKIVEAFHAVPIGIGEAQARKGHIQADVQGK
jgi:hypothetical protein